MIQHGVGLGELVALAFARHHMQKLRAAQLLDVVQRWQQRIEIVAVDGADVVKTEFLEHGTGRHHAFDMLFRAPRDRAQHFLPQPLGPGIKTPRHQTREIFIERAHRRRDRHVVVVQDHQQIDIHVAGIVQRLERHAARQRAVTDNRDCLTPRAGELARHRHAQRRADRGAGMCGAEGVVFRFRALREA